MICTPTSMRSSEHQKRSPGRARAEGEEMNRRLWIALIIIAGAVIAVVVLLAIETLLIDWDSFA
jgi:hypothetical protein